jgi:MOSC domain-containing protein YiiM
MSAPGVASVARSQAHTFKKAPCEGIVLIEGLGVEGDAHAGALVKHRSRVAKDPTQPNLRQVHLIHSELFDELAASGFVVKPGDLGENITTHGIDLLGLPKGALLHLGSQAVIEITGLRNPCGQIDRFSQGLLQAVLGRDSSGGLIRKSGIMAIVRRGGLVRVDDAILVELPTGAHAPLQPV